jgi:molybdopterin-binding protein
LALAERDRILERTSVGKRSESMKLSARNVFKGRVKSIVVGAVNDEVVIELPGGIEVVSVITKSSAASLGLSVGKEAYAIIKASSVLLGVD